jgi:cell division control protein 45
LSTSALVWSDCTGTCTLQSLLPFNVLVSSIVYTLPTTSCKYFWLLQSIVLVESIYRMILELENWYLGYSQILTDCRKGGSALVLCNADVDSMAAGRILSYMLRNDTISYQLLPCMSYSQLQKRILDNCNDNVRAVILLNLGASRNLTRLFNDDEFGHMLNPTTTKLYVMDCRRPVHLSNIHAETNVVVFWDGVQQDDDIPSDGDNLSGDESSDTSDEDDEVDDATEGSDNEGEHEFDDDVECGSSLSRTTSFNHGQDQPIHGNSEDERESKKRLKEKDNDDDLSHSVEGNPDEHQQQVQIIPTMTPRELHQDRRNRLRQYYSCGSYYGSPAAYTAYTIASQLRFQEIGDLLWLACVGVTDAYVHSRLDVAGYSALAMQLRNICQGLFPNDEFSRVSNTTYSEHLLGTDANQLTRIAFSGNGRILTEPDFRFFLLRHSSLYDAMVYSDYVSTRLQLSTATGMHRLREMLAKMGFSLEECQQPFAFMKSSLRRQLQSKFRDYAEEYGLVNFEYTSFFRITGYQSLLSACDTSYAVTALLECDAAVGTSLKNGSTDDEERLLKTFNIAFDALNSNQSPPLSLSGLSGEGNTLSYLVNGGKLTGSSGLGAGICLAMNLQKSIFATASSLVERNALIRLSHFRYAYITCTSQGENEIVGPENVNSENSRSEENEIDHIFAKPLALTRLAQYLMDMHRENGKWTGNKARPLVLMAEKPRSKSFLVVGYEFPESAGDLVRNRFGKNFELAAQSMKGTFLFDSFESNVVEVARIDVQRFIEQLHYLLDSL